MMAHTITKTSFLPEDFTMLMVDDDFDDFDEHFTADDCPLVDEYLSDAHDFLADLPPLIMLPVDVTDLPAGDDTLAEPASHTDDDFNMFMVDDNLSAGVFLAAEHNDDDDILTSQSTELPFYSGHISNASIDSILDTGASSNYIGEHALRKENI
jgi:hypothetical protein